MIILKEAIIENFRSISGNPLELKFNEYNVFVGPNNCGKSNILRALQLFFTGKIEKDEFNPNIDFPKNILLPGTAKTKITVTIQYDRDKEIKINNALDELERESSQERLDDQLVKLRLSISKNGVMSWTFVGKRGIQSIKKELVHKVRDSVLQSIVYKYIPVGRDSLQSIKNELSTELIKTIFKGYSGAVGIRRDINSAIEELMRKLNPQLQASSELMTNSIRTVFQEISKMELKLPFDNLETMLPNLIPSIHDTYETDLEAKGAGIQTSSLLFLLKYLADNHPQRHNSRITFIWAIEEPESFLHPARQKGMAQILKEFSSEVQTLITSHNANFVPKSSLNNQVYVIEKDITIPFSTNIVGQDFEIARASLGVSIIDSMYLYPINIVVEGPSDEILLRGILERFRNDFLTNGTDIDDVKFISGGNASGACVLYETFLKFIENDVAAIKLIIDGDEAGGKALRGLQQRMRNSHLDFRANTDYFQLRVDIEHLIDDRVKRAIATTCTAQVILTEDIDGGITAFKVIDGHKISIARKVLEMSTDRELKKFHKLLKQIFETI